MNAALAPAAVVVRRTIAAPPKKLFDAWLDPIALTTWMRPGTIRSTQAQIDARVGGEYQIVMQAESGEVRHSGIYKLIDRPRKLVFTWISAPTENRETLVTVDFLPVGSGTEVVVTHERLPESALPSHSRGWTSGLAHLDEACTAGLLP
jgi:uncharacterized protein YndB with AHSA1/START domain